MSWDEERFPRYVTAAERRRRGLAMIERMRKRGRDVTPIEIEGRAIASTFWGKAWCDNLESYSDFANRLPRGRTYVRNGSVLDLQIEPGKVRALVNGSELYKVAIAIARLPASHWKRIKRRTSGQLGSLVELLRGTLSGAVMEAVTSRGEGLFPTPAEITLACSCPDWASMCKHVAAALYGVGARLDQDPALLFQLRGVDPSEMAQEAVLPAPPARVKHGRKLAAEDLSAVFGVDIETTALPGEQPSRVQAPRSTRSEQNRATAARTGPAKRATAKKKQAPAKKKQAPATKKKKAPAKKKQAPAKKKKAPAKKKKAPAKKKKAPVNKKKALAKAPGLQEGRQA